MTIRNSGLYEAVSRMAQVFSSPERLHILDLLAQRRRTVEDVARAAHISVKLASHHLQVLRREDLVSVKKSGRYAFYELADARVAGFWLTLRGFVEDRNARLARERQRMTARRQQQGSLLDRETALEQIRKGSAVVIDVRPREEFEHAHLPRAKSIPLEEIEQRADEIPRGPLVIVYCRGPYCELADEAVEILKKRGVKAYRLEEGPLDWSHSGFPVENQQQAMEVEES